MAKAASQDHGNHHIVPLWQYAVTLFILMAFMGLTIFASGIEFGSKGPISGNVINNLVALGIAFIKALLVVMIFMGVKWGTSLIKLWALAGFTWVTLMSIILLDYGTRKYETVAEWGGGAETALPRTPESISEGGKQPTNENYLNVRPRQ